MGFFEANPIVFVAIAASAGALGGAATSLWLTLRTLRNPRV